MAKVLMVVLCVFGGLLYAITKKIFEDSLKKVEGEPEYENVTDKGASLIKKFFKLLGVGTRLNYYLLAFVSVVLITYFVMTDGNIKDVFKEEEKPVINVTLSEDDIKRIRSEAEVKVRQELEPQIRKELEVNIRKELEIKIRKELEEKIQKEIEEMVLKELSKYNIPPNIETKGNSPPNGE